jgi:SNF2 family DNA or RNA helicase
MKRRGVLDASEMGTGKGVTALELARILGEPCLAIVPASLCHNWMREAARLFPELKMQRYDAKFRLKKDTNIIVMSYEMIGRCPELFKVARVYLIDEAQYCCNPKAKRSKTLHDYIKKYKPRRLLLMSGTILNNKIPDLYHPLKLLDFVNNCGFREAFPSWGSFAREFTHTRLVKRGGFMVTEYEGLRNEEELREWIKPIYIRYTMQETDLPPLRLIEIGIEGGSKALESQLRTEWGAFQAGRKQEMWDEDEETVGGEHFSTAKARNAFEKAEKTGRFALDLLEQGLGPLVVFTDHVRAACRLAEIFEGAEYSCSLVHGSISMRKRDEFVENFQAGLTDVLVATTKTMGVGQTLTAASICIVNDKNWLPSANRQAMKRIHRIGQTKPCIVYSIVREGIDEQIEAALQRKDAIEQRALGGLGE